jgi:hypothetical protein
MGSHRGGDISDRHLCAAHRSFRGIGDYAEQCATRNLRTGNRGAQTEKTRTITTLRILLALMLIMTVSRKEGWINAHTTTLRYLA